MPEVSSVDGVKIFYEVIGDSDITLVLIGGWGVKTGKAAWRHQLSLSSNYRLVLIDLAGHGRSGKNREKYTMELYGQDVKAVIEKLDLTEIILLGWSMGGAVILETELLLSDRVIGLIPVDSLFVSPGNTYTKMDEDTINGAIRPYEENFIESYTNLINSFISEKFDPQDVKNAQTHAHQLDKRSMISALIELLKWNVNDVLPKIKKPIKCIVAGRTIEHFSKEKYEEIFDTIYLEDLGHLMPLEDPQKFNSAVEECIAKLISL